jgi:hypothetical protein
LFNYHPANLADQRATAFTATLTVACFSTPQILAELYPSLLAGTDIATKKQFSSSRATGCYVLIMN